MTAALPPPAGGRQTAIAVRNLGKKYRLYDSPAHRLREALHPFRKRYHRDFWALRDVSFEVGKGETVGIIGKNGSGKSTLLQILCGILQPSEGSVQIQGKISALLELGAGFNPAFTGRQNVYMNGALMGFGEREMDARFQSIADFADIGDFMDQPVKTYSSGMFVRLAFAAAINADPDILVVDEALSVGDMFFQAKCMTRMKKLIEGGVTLLFVSHDTSSIKSLCSKAVLLDGGSLVCFDDAERAVEHYFSLMVRERQQVAGQAIQGNTTAALASAAGEGRMHAAFADNSLFLKKASFERIQNGKASFINVQLLNEDLADIQSVAYLQTVVLRMCIEVNEDIHQLSCGYHIKDKNGISIVNSNLSIEDRMLQSPAKGERYVVDWKFRVPMMEGIYNIGCVLSVPVNLQFGEVDFCDYVPCALQFEMQRMKISRLYGYVHLENALEITKLEGPQ